MINKNNLMKLSKEQLADILLGLMNTVESLLQREDSSQNIILPTPEFCADYRPKIKKKKIIRKRRKLFPMLPFVPFGKPEAEPNSDQRL